MKKCAKAKRLLSGYLDKETPDKGADFIRRHLSDCRICSREYSNLLNIKNMLSGRERTVLAQDHIVKRLYTNREFGKRYSLLDSLGSLSRSFMPVPAVIAALFLAFVISDLRKDQGRYYLEDYIMSAGPVTTELALELILTE
ncbi:MAG: zf-HC2 domain-containing protein [Candidatus Omnitrophica bacterium]|nr:zf-HC2 domain-containing protein [Candidatus Omnitrophota bacterium]